MKNVEVKDVAVKQYCCKTCGKPVKISVFEQDQTGIKSISLICADCQVVDILPYQEYLDNLNK